MPKNASLRSQRARKGLTVAALPTAVAVGLALLPSAAAQSSLGDLSSNSSLSDAIAPQDPPKRTPINTEYPDVEGLPEGVDIKRVEYLTNRNLMVYIQSAAMPNEDMKVQIQLARDWYANPDKTFPEVWALDGLRARDDESGWTIETNIEDQYADRNVNLIMPVGGESSFYADWEKPDQGKHYKWETFLTKELIPILDKQFRSNQKRALTGISMGGTAAINLAERNPQLFDFVGSFSGYLDTTTQGMPQASEAAQLDAGGYRSTNMWGPIGSQNWIDHDPKLGIENLKDMTVYVSSGSGKDDFGDPESVAKGPANLAGMGLEVISRMSTQTFLKYADRAGVKPIAKFRPSGVHSWEYWQFEMNQAWSDIADSLDIAKEDRGAECTPIGAIKAEAAKYKDLGTCLNNEYDAEDGKAQDFRGGAVYWSPDTGAHALWGRIGARYSEIGGPSSWLGFPKTSELTTPDGKGRFVHFENGSIYWSPQTGAWEVPRDIMSKWGATKWEQGTFKYPTSSLQSVGRGLQQFFQGGVITRNPDNNNYTVYGAIGAKYKELDGAKSALGFPVAEERPVPRNGRMQEFEHGYIYWSARTGAHYVMKGNIYNEWGKRGWESGKLGFPTKDFSEIAAGGLTQEFENGRISEVMGRIRVEER
ncbi:putative esterase [Corynebacterium camporealensis]|uniref:alpha/beta hydrolase-fold protein n=1 Tax=Corynebacterium camporealensis TaxID=161896 RepID=UPI000CF9CC14|nr:alpha/beta hydrolase-fold protein [Corynebacterium camporealensis]AVH89152.1 putative esterase [Corynebacterium camporealensis]